MAKHVSNRPQNQVSVRAVVIGLTVGATLAILFAATGHPGLMGVGAAIGASLVTVLNAEDARQDRRRGGGGGDKG